MNTVHEFLANPPNQPPVRGFLHQPASPSGDALILTHGAGANCNAPLLVALAAAFCHFGWIILRCDLPFRQLRSHGPPPRGSAERDQQGLKAAINSMRQQTAGRMFMGGHSYGGRQTSMLAAAEPGLVDRLLLLSYPLHPPQHPDQLRTAHFSSLRSPAMFVHGERDGFGSILEISEALQLIPAPTRLVTIPAVGHELLTKQNQNDLPPLIAEAFCSYDIP